MERRGLVALLAMMVLGCGGGNKEGGTTSPDLSWESDVPVGNDDVIGDGHVEDLDQSVQPDNGTPDASEPTENEWYPSYELGVRILSPSSLGWAEVAGGAISVAGVVMGNGKSVTWNTDKGGSGTAVGLPFFNSGRVDLVPGDNLVTVTVSNGVETVTDSIHLTYNPGFSFGELRIIPGGFFTNQAANLRFALSMDAFGNFDAGSLVLCECTETGACLQGQIPLADDGDTAASGDEVQGDAVYSAKKEYTRNQAGQMCFRANVTVKAAQPYTAMSPVRCVDVVEHFSPAQCEASKNVLKEAKTRYDNGLGQGGPGVAAQATLDYLQTAPGVAQAGASTGGFGLWVRFQNGVLGAVDTSPDGNRGNGNSGLPWDIESAGLPLLEPSEVKIESKRSVVVSPFRSEFGENDEAQYIATLLNNSSCPPYIVDGPYNDGFAGLSVWRSLSEYGIVIITSHGDAYFRDMDSASKKQLGWRHMGSQEVMWSGEGVDCAQMSQGAKVCSAPADCPKGTECVITEYGTGGDLLDAGVSGICVDFKQIDLRRGNLVLGSERYGVLPTHIEEYRGNGYPRSLVYLGSCRTMWNGTMAMSFAAAGAQTILGYTGYVTSQFAYMQGREAMAEMLQEQKLSGLSMPPRSAQDPANPGTYLALFGAESLNVFDSEIINPSFERGDLTGWLKDGDGRVVSRLGETGSAEGKFMALLSTGLGYTQQTGTIEQVFCIPAEREELKFYWKLYSEEFKEFCGSTYMDTFEAVLESDQGQITLVNTWIDALCPPSECSGCGSQYVGMVESDVSFDIGDVWNIEWQEVRKDITALAGAGPVTLRFFTGDVGDSIYDTAVLVDTITFE